RLQRRGGRAADAVVDAALPPPTLRLPHTRPCLGDGGQGPHRPRPGRTNALIQGPRLGTRAPAVRLAFRADRAVAIVSRRSSVAAGHPPVRRPPGRQGGGEGTWPDRRRT